MAKVTRRVVTKGPKKQSVPIEHRERRAEIKAQWNPEVAAPDGRRSKALTDAEMQSFAGRVRDAREKADKTQDTVARHLGISRAAVAQWERAQTVPPVHMIQELARFLGTTPQWLAFAVPGEPKVIVKELDDPAFTKIPEVVFDSPTSTREVGKWGAPTSWVDVEIRPHTREALVMVECEADNMSPRFQPGDKLLIDGSARKPSPPGIFAHWDGYNVAINQIAIIPGPHPMARISSLDGQTATYEVPAEQVTILGRVRGVWQPS